MGTWHAPRAVTLSPLDAATFALFLAAVLVVSLWASRRGRGGEDAEGYFLAGRGLGFGLIGVSLVASNISSEHFVGMAGKGFELGLAIASFEWIAAPALVFVAFVLLPRFLRAGITTLPEYLELRYDARARAIMALYLLVMYVVAAMAGVLFTGGLALQSIFGLDLTVGVWAIGALAGVYTIYGGLRAVVWSDLIQGTALLLGGALLLFLGLREVGGVEPFLEHNREKLHMVLPASHPLMPWTIFLLGIWIPNLAYWGLNQFIAQRALAARSLAAGQRGLVLAAFLKLWIPFLVVFPGMLAFQLYGSQITRGDEAYPHMVQQLVPAGLRGVLLAALFGAIMSSLDSMLNSASTIFTVDLYQRHLARREPDSRRLLRVGRASTAVFLVAACLIAPQLLQMGPVYDYMQRAWNFIWPGILAVFLLGLAWPRVPPVAASFGLLFSVPAYGCLSWILAIPYLNAAALSFLLTCAGMAVLTWWRPTRPRGLRERPEVDLTPSRAAAWSAAAVVTLTVLLYAVFW
jgi:SSS family solute:Na+ symporter